MLNQASSQARAAACQRPKAVKSIPDIAPCGAKLRPPSSSTLVPLPPRLVQQTSETLLGDLGRVLGGGEEERSLMLPPFGEITTLCDSQGRLQGCSYWLCTDLPCSSGHTFCRIVARPFLLSYFCVPSAYYGKLAGTPQGTEMQRMSTQMDK